MLTFLLFLALAGPALAVDGVLEINQTCAINTGCFSGDTPGFPVTISSSGSYRLTSNLTTVLDNTDAISGTAPNPAGDVTIDLNGFAVTGTGATSNAVGVRFAEGNNWEVRNGTIREFFHGFSTGPGASEGHRLVSLRVVDNVKDGIRLNLHRDSTVEGCTVARNGFNGVIMAQGGSAIGNVVASNGNIGMSLASGVGYANNVVDNNSVGTVSGGVEMGANVCDGNTTCP
jgi:hypothetical protein